MHPDDLESRRKLFAERVHVHAADRPEYLILWQKWRNRLLAIGGVDVVPPAQRDETIGRLLRDSCTVDADAVELDPGRPSSCHENVALLAAHGSTRAGTLIGQVWTGYALSDDGLWRQHSWASTGDGTVVETTEPRIAYAGVCVWDRTDDELEAG